MGVENQGSLFGGSRRSMDDSFFGSYTGVLLRMKSAISESFKTALMP